VTEQKTLKAYFLNNLLCEPNGISSSLIMFTMFKAIPLYSYQNTFITNARSFCFQQYFYK